LVIGPEVLPDNILNHVHAVRLEQVDDIFKKAFAIVKFVETVINNDVD
jgi:hypothetical protein